MIEVSILLVSVAISASIGLFVLVRNPKSIVNRLYALLTFAFVLYPIANYFSLQTDDRLWFIRAVVFFTTIAVASMYHLVFFLNNPGAVQSRLQKLGVLYSVIVAILCWTPLIFSGLNPGPDPAPTAAPLAILFLLHLVIFLGATFLSLTKRAHATRGAQHLQYIYMLLGMAPILLLAPITSFIMPIVFDNTSLIGLSPLYATCFVGGVGVAIIKHKLFDIGFFAIRAAAYITTLIVISFVVILPIILILGRVLDLDLSWPQAIAAAAVATMIVYSLQYLRYLFDRLTARVFFRHYYDPQAVLEKINDTLVRTAEIEALTTETATIIQDALKTTNFRYVLFAGSKEDAKLAKSIREKVSNTDLIDVDESEGISKLFVDHLRKHDIALAVKLRTKQEDLGYLVLGPKRSGEGYLERDKQLLQVVAGEVAIGLQNALRFEEIERFNVTLQEKIEEATKKLRQTNEKLRTLDQTKDDFISMASHQLRTPLTSVKGYVSMVLDGDAGKLTGLQRKLLNQSFISSQRMVYLISDLLNVSRLRTGRFIIEPVPCNLSKVIKDEVDQLQETAKGRSLTLTFNHPEHFPVLMLDETKIRQVVMNFIDNAIYYTPSGGHITINLIDKPNSIEFSVTDDGIGVPRHEQHHLFTKFFRAHNAKRARPDGTGLGLFMAKKVVIAQGGAIVFKSSEGKGSTFGFTFSKDKLAPLPPPKTPLKR